MERLVVTCDQCGNIIDADYSDRKGDRMIVAQTIEPSGQSTANHFCSWLCLVRYGDQKVLDEAEKAT